MDERVVSERAPDVPNEISPEGAARSESRVVEFLGEPVEGLLVVDQVQQGFADRGVL